MLRQLLVLLSTVAALGCSSVLGIKPPVPTILQGNIYAPEDLEKLEKGMSKNQVLYILGTPVLRPLYQPDEWYYYRSAVREGETILRRLLVLNFENQALADWEIRLTADVPDDFISAEPPPAAEQSEQSEQPAGDSSQTSEPTTDRTPDNQ